MTFTLLIDTLFSGLVHYGALTLLRAYLGLQPSWGIYGIIQYLCFSFSRVLLTCSDKLSESAGFLARSD